MKKINIDKLINFLERKFKGLIVTSKVKDLDYNNSYTLGFKLSGNYLSTIGIAIEDILKEKLDKYAYHIEVKTSREKKNEKEVYKDGIIELAFNDDVKLIDNYENDDLLNEDDKLSSFSTNQVKINQEKDRERKKKEFEERKKQQYNKKIYNIINQLYIELKHKKKEKEEFEWDMEQELERISDISQQEKQAQIWGKKLNKLELEIDTLQQKINNNRVRIKESVSKEFNFNDKLDDFINYNWQNPIEEEFVNQLKKYEENIKGNENEGKEYLQNLFNENKRLLQTNCSSKFLDDFKKIIGTGSFFNLNKKSDIIPFNNKEEEGDNNDLDNEKGFDIFNNFNGQNNLQKESNELKGSTPYFNKNTQKLYSDIPYITESEKLETEFIRVKIKHKRNIKLPKELLAKIFSLLKDMFDLTKYDLIINSKITEITIKKLPLQNYVDLNSEIKNINPNLEVILIGLYTGSEYKERKLNENNLGIINKLFDYDPVYILGRLDEFFYDSNSQKAISQWEEYKNKLNLNINNFNSWYEYFENTNSNGEKEIKTAIAIIKSNNLEGELKSFFRLVESIKKTINEYYLYFPTKEYCYEVKADMTMNPYNTNKNPKLYFSSENIAKNFVETQKAGNCEYIGKVDLKEANQNKIEELKLELTRLLKLHDWYYFQQDSNKKYVKGLEEEEKIDKLVNELNSLTNSDLGTKLYNKYNLVKLTKIESKEELPEYVKNIINELIEKNIIKDPEEVISFYNTIKNKYFLGSEKAKIIKKHFGL